MYSLLDVLLPTMLIMLVYVLAWFALGVLLRRRDIADSAWGLGFVLAAWNMYALRNNESLVALIASCLVTAWGVRLFLHISTRTWKKPEDPRYAALGKLGSLNFWFRTFYSVFLLQGVLIILVSLPILAIMYTTSEPLMPLVVIGFGLWIFGIIYESVADWQLRRFLRSGKKGIMQTGLWRTSRHPNYFGELVVWWGATTVAVAFGQWWGIIGAVVITVLITKVSGIPPLEKRYAGNPDFQKYAKRTSVLIPMPVKKHV